MCVTGWRCNAAHLSLGTDADNMADMTRKGRRFRKISDEMLAEIQALIAGGSTQSEIARSIGVSPSTISGRINRARRSSPRTGAAERNQGDE